MNGQETIANLNMIRIAFVEPVTKEQRKLIDDTFDNAIQALEQEPCEDAISRQAVFEQINCWIGSGEYRYTNAMDYLNKRIKALQAVKPQKEGEYLKSAIRISKDIPKEAVLNAIHEAYINAYDEQSLVRDLTQAVNELPPVNQDPKTGHPQKSCNTCEYSDEIDGSNCYECVKDMRNNYSPKKMVEPQGKER